MAKTRGKAVNSDGRKVGAGAAPPRGNNKTCAPGVMKSKTLTTTSPAAVTGNTQKVPSLEKRFTSKDVKDVYDNVFKYKSAIVERGIGTSVSKLVSDEVRKRKWESFVAPPPPANMSAVREFYAECSKCDADARFVMLRGKRVDFSPKFINSVCHTPNIPEIDDFEAVLSRMEGDILDIAKDFLCPSAAWNSSKADPLQRLSFSSSTLSPDARAWHKFFACRVRPTTHTTDLKPDEICLLYAVLKDISIDVGRLIFRGIHTYAAHPTGRLLYPSIITLLAQRAEVPMGDTDEILSKKTTSIVSSSSKSRPSKRKRAEVKPLSLEELFRKDVYTIARSNQQWMESMRRDSANNRAMLDAIYKKLDGDPSKFPPICLAPFEYPPFVYPDPFGPPTISNAASENGDVSMEPSDDDRDPLDVLVATFGPGPSAGSSSANATRCDAC